LHARVGARVWFVRVASCARCGAVHRDERGASADRRAAQMPPRPPGRWPGEKKRRKKAVFPLGAAADLAYIAAA
jgi:hypothetical protein